MNTSSRKQGVWAKVISFDLGLRGSQKVKFYRRLFGYTIKSTSQRSFVPGLLSHIPHLMLGRSVIAIPPEAHEEVMNFLSSHLWRPLEIHVVDALLSPQQYESAIRGTMKMRVRLTGGEVTLEEAVRMVQKREKSDPDRKIVVSLLQELCKYSWTRKLAMRILNEL